MAAQVQGAVECAVDRALERIGAMARGKLPEAERAQVSALDNGQVARQLGPKRLQQLLGDDGTLALVTEANLVARRVARWAGEADLEDPVALASRAVTLTRELGAEALWAKEPSSLHVQAVEDDLFGVLVS